MMSKIKQLKEIINLITELDKDTLNDTFVVEHDELYLPIPKNLTIDAKRKIEEYGHIDEEEDCIKIFV